jgi:DNA-binding response OmpR family regulator
MHSTTQSDDNRGFDRTSSAAVPCATLEVLLVTADSDLREVGERVLTREGYRVRVAAHSGHAVLAGLTSRVDVLVAELSAPDISGPSLAQLLRRHHPDLRVVFMANPGTPEGLEHVVVRPFTRDDLLARITSSLTARPTSSAAAS